MKKKDLPKWYFFILIILVFIPFFLFISSVNSPLPIYNPGKNGISIPNDKKLEFLSTIYKIKWYNNGTPICTEINNQMDSALCPDGVGGAIVTWRDDRVSASDSNIYAQRISAGGVLLWTLDGKPICTSDAYQSLPKIVSDGNRGAIITWQDNRTGSDDIYAQKIDSRGNIQWIPNGTPICNLALHQQIPSICSDGEGGAIITWADERDGPPGIYAQRINSSGYTQWLDNGTAICNISYHALPKIVEDGDGGAIIVWEDNRNGLVAGKDLYAQRINSSGFMLWKDNGVEICTEFEDQYSVDICSDKNGGAIFSWLDFRDSIKDIYTQKINSTGYIKWNNNGTLICSYGNSQYSPRICDDSYEGAIICWYDNRFGDFDIYAQRINSTGTINWTTNGILICNESSTQFYPRICSDQNGGAFITWGDQRYTNTSIFLQQVNGEGQVNFTADGIPVCTERVSLYAPSIVSDQMGGAIVSWNDYRNSDYDIYIQRIRNNLTNTWKSATVISDGYKEFWGWNSGTSCCSSVAADSNGIIHVVWQDNTNGSWGTDSEIMYVNYTMTTGWSNVTIISDDYLGWNDKASCEPSITTDKFGNVHVVWHDETVGAWGTDVEIMYANYTAEGWSNATVISDDYTGWNDGNSYHSSIAVDDNGNIHVTWDDWTIGEWGSDIEIMYANYTAAEGWSNATVISDGYGGVWGWNTGESSDPSIAIDNNGNIHVVWQDETNGQWGIDQEIMYVNYTAKGWSNVTVISDGYGGIWDWNDAYSNFSRIITDVDGNLHVVWQDDTNGEWGTDTEIMYANYTSMGWSNVSCISDIYGWNNNESNYPSIAADNDDNIHVVWQDWTTGEWGTDWEIMYINYTTAGWSNATCISDFIGWNDGDSKNPCIITDENGNIHVVWDDDTNGEWGSDWEIIYIESSAYIELVSEDEPPRSDPPKSLPLFFFPESDIIFIIILIIMIGSVVIVAIVLYAARKQKGEIKVIQPTKKPIKILKEDLVIRRAYDYVGGAIRYKIVVENTSDRIIRDILVSLEIKKQQYEIDTPINTIDILEPGESIGTDFILTPLTCGKSRIHGKVSYKTAKSELISMEITPNVVQIKCPLVQPKKLSSSNLISLMQTLQRSHSEINFEGLTKPNAYRIAKEQISSLDVTKVEEEEEKFHITYSGVAKVGGDLIIIELIIIQDYIVIDIYLEDIKQATGFLAYIKNLINLAIKYSRKISTTMDVITSKVYNAFEFTQRLSELNNLCIEKAPIDNILLILKELHIKSNSYFPDLQVTKIFTEIFNKWIADLEKITEDEIWNRTYLNLQYDILTCMDAIIILLESNTKNYFESPGADEQTKRNIQTGNNQLRGQLNKMNEQYARMILFALMLINKSSGVNMYNYNFAETALDSDLIGGFLTAIRSFGMELGAEAKETGMQKLSYQHFEIGIQDGKYTVIALITSGLPNKLIIERQKEMLLKFEKEFEVDLEKFAGNVGIFKDTENLVNEIFLNI